MSFNAERLYRLLPAAHRLRDENAIGTLANNPTPGALRELIEIIADQVAVLEEELEQLYDNQFVETAAPWALPYLGELLGLRGLDLAGHSARFAPRAEVANTIAYRRRKGTAAILEQLARDITGRPAAAVEFWKKIAATQHVNHIRSDHLAWVSLRNARQLEFTGTPFEQAARTVEVRRIEPGLGRWNIPNLGLFVWRLRDAVRTRSPLAPSHLDDRHLRLHPLGMDAALCVRPKTETDITHLAEPENVPALLTRRLFAREEPAESTGPFHPDEKWYGTDDSVQLWRLEGKDWKAIPADEIVVCNLHDVYEDDDPTKPIVRWGHDATNDPATPDAERVCHGKILLDPLRGCVVLPEAEPVFATFSVLSPGDVGGGEYARSSSFTKASASNRFVAQQPVEKPEPDTKTTITDALAGVTKDLIIQVRDSGHYLEDLPDLAASSLSIELRSEDGRWPVLTLSDAWALGGNSDGAITLNGLLITGQGITIGEDLGALNLRHCTLLPGLNIGVDGRLDSSAARPVALDVQAPGTNLKLENCIIGPLRVAPDVSVRLKNCVVDAGAEDAWAIGASGRPTGTPGGMWRMENCTIIGRIAAHGIELASNTIFLGASVDVERRQEGCVRFCWLPPKAVVPRRHRCVSRVERDDSGHESTVEAQPQFLSRRFGEAGYCQLRVSCSDYIRRGADDEGEMGVWHDLLEPRREAHLRARLRDYLRFSLEAGIFYEQNTPSLKAAGT